MEASWQQSGVRLALSFVAASIQEDAMNIFVQLQRWVDPEGGFVLAIALLSVAAALVLILAP